MHFESPKPTLLILHYHSYNIPYIPLFILHYITLKSSISSHNSIEPTQLLMRRERMAREMVNKITKITLHWCYSTIYIYILLWQVV